jgi:hypothetical protein
VEKWKQINHTIEHQKFKTKQRRKMESNTFASTSARRYRIVDAEERSHSILFNTISNFCGLKRIEINKTKKSKNMRQNIELAFLHQKKFSKRKYVWTIWRYLSRDCCILYLSLYWCTDPMCVWYITKCALISATIFMRSTIHKNIKKVEEKSQNSLKVAFLSRTSRNWWTDPIHVID